MATVSGNKSAGHFPAPAPPGVQAGATASGAPVTASNWPHNSGALAGAAGSITINGIAVKMDLTIHTLENVVALINASNAAVASIGRNGQLVLTGPGALAFGGSQALLVALGLA